MQDDKKNLTKSLGKRMTHVASFLVAGKAISLIINLFTFVIIARLIGPSNYGIYTIIMAIAALFGGFGNPNITAYIAERAPKLISAGKLSEAKRLFGDTLVLSIIFGIILTTIALFLSPFLSSYSLHNLSYSLILDFAILTIFFSLIYSTLYYHILSLNKGGSLATSSVIHATSQGIFGIMLVLLGFGILGAISGFLLGLIIGTIFELYVLITSIGITISTKKILLRMKKALLFSKDIAYTNILNTIISNFSVIFLGLIVSSSLVGYYGIASKVGSLIDVFIGAVALAVLPMFSEAIYKKKQGANAGKLFYYSVYMSLIFATPIILLLSIFSNEIIYIAFNTAYIGAVFFMQIISIGILMSIFSSYGISFLITSSKQNKVLKFTSISVILQAIFLFILTPYFGVIGMIIATFYIGNISLSALYINYISKSGVQMHKWKIARLVLANIIFATILIPFSFISPNSIGLLLGVVLMFVLYPILIGFIKAITKKDIEIIKSASKSIPILGIAIFSLASYMSRFC